MNKYLEKIAEMLKKTKEPVVETNQVAKPVQKEPSEEE